MSIFLPSSTSTETATCVCVCVCVECFRCSCMFYSLLPHKTQNYVSFSRSQKNNNQTLSLPYLVVKPRPVCRGLGLQRPGQQRREARSRGIYRVGRRLRRSEQGRDRSTGNSDDRSSRAARKRRSRRTADDRRPLLRRRVTQLDAEDPARFLRDPLVTRQELRAAAEGDPKDVGDDRVCRGRGESRGGDGG